MKAAGAKGSSGLAAVFFAEKRVNKGLQALLWADLNKAQRREASFLQVRACPFS
jgi:hypothetical protein